MNDAITQSGILRTATSQSGALTGDERESQLVSFYAQQFNEELSLGLGLPEADHQTRMATWFLGKKADIQAKRELIKQQADVMLRQLDAMEKGLDFHFGLEFKSIIDAKLQSQGGKKKSVDFLTGRAGYRARPASVMIVDERAAVEWCKNNCPEAIEMKIARKTPIKEHVEKYGEEVPGTVFSPSVDNFYPSVNRPALESILYAQIEGVQQQ